eukprot:543413-Pelagomonas_calceolata.AAC.3
MEAAHVLRPAPCCEASLPHVVLVLHCFPQTAPTLSPALTAAAIEAAALTSLWPNTNTPGLVLAARRMHPLHHRP